MISPVPGGLLGAPRRWDFLATLMLEQKYKTFVEVGCKEGRTTGHILKTVPDSRVVAIDPWCQQLPSERDKTRETYKDWNFEEIEKEFWNNVGEHKGRCLMWRMTSKDAAAYAEQAPPEFSVEHPDQFDIVFIDALHDYESVMQDISLWWPLVRTGGILAGHDFNHKWPGVERAVADHFNLMGVGVGFDSVWFVLKQ